MEREVMVTTQQHSDHVLDEMSIVDIFTKLIFDAESALTGDETWVVELLGQVEPGLSAVSRRDLSEHLRAMGVQEMIKTVARLRAFMEKQQGVIAGNAHPSSRPLHR
jgi:hypothetical protein